MWKEMFVDANIEIMEVLQILKDECYSNVTGFLTRGPNKEGAMGPLYPISGPVPVAVTTGNSCYDVSRRLRINQDETFVTFYNKSTDWKRDRRIANPNRALSENVCGVRENGRRRWQSWGKATPNEVSSRCWLDGLSGYRNDRPGKLHCAVELGRREEWIV